MGSSCTTAYLIRSHFYLLKFFIHIYTSYFLYLVYGNKTVYNKVTISNITIITTLTKFNFSDNIF